ncbi:hypothetical protein C8D87_105350 [Lentzea atacamensis]|uniref:Uncharacterized protein n=1 Tax=Lentzea atacamensis TaxID=531938 RepID=A0ABX9E9K2_9PSEU|nr:hypothetical protein [Lentzea atacamensis]RAS64856.1 hypothetical protein C8D87_105350 [Lentzea atacamensis]
MNFAGFALPESKYTAGLFKLTDNLVRAIAQRSPQLTAVYPWLPRCEEWLRTHRIPDARCSRW